MNKIVEEIQQDLKRMLPDKLKTLKINKKILGKGSYGVIKQLSLNRNTKLYALKIVQFPKYLRRTEQDKFKHEVRVGKNKNIEKFGLKIHYHKVNAEYGWYIMDHIQKRHPKGHVYTLFQYFNMFNRITIPDNHKLYRLLHTKLKNFYKYAKGYHGDLHTKNIAVILNKKDSTESDHLLDLIIYDYGTFIPFKSNDTNNFSLMNYLSLSKKEFNTNNKMTFNRNYDKNVPMKVHDNFGSQLFRANYNMFMKLTYEMYGYPRYFVNKMLELNSLRSRKRNDR